MNLVTATDLTQRAECKDAEAKLPQLVRRLIAATTSGFSRISIRAGEGVALAGWDDITDAEHSSTFVPQGTYFDCQRSAPGGLLQT